MFNDEVPFASNKMHEFSTVDGFVEVTECVAEMIKFVANEPSVGLFYVQQHAQNAVPNLINLKNNVVEKSREMTLHTQDLEESITMVRSMKECGFPIADDMIKDIRKSLAIMSTKQPKRGLIHSPSSGFQMGRTSSWGPASWGLTAVSVQQDGESSGSYLSTVLKSAKQKASNFKWPQFDSKELRQAKGEKPLSDPNPPLSVAAPGTTLTLPDTEADELPPSSQIADELQEEEEPIDEGLSSHQLLTVSETFDEFRANREAKLEEWLGGTGNRDGRVGGTDAEGL
uniref:MEF2BNB-like protein n=1 Tax=Davidia involucrata TaxID=16924 RepID=A0A5B7BTI0_DAVIN